MNKNNLIKKFVMILILGVLFSGIISAFGVGTPYMKEINGVRTFEVYENNAENFEVVLQSGTENPMNVKVSILEGSEVIELLEDNDIFLVNPNEKVSVKFRILAPKGAVIGDSFSVRLGFASSDVGEGALAFGTAIEKGFDVLLVEMPVYAGSEETEEETAGQVAIIIFLALIILLILIIIVLKVKRSKREKAMKNKQPDSVKKKSAPKKKK